MDWVDELLYWFEGRFQVIIGVLVFLWVLGRIISKAKKAKSALGQAPAAPPATAEPQAREPQALNWDGDDDDTQPETSVPLADGYVVSGPGHFTTPDRLPYREEGVKAGCLIFALIVFAAGGVIYYFFEQDIMDLWRELMETLGYNSPDPEPLKLNKDH